MTAHYPSDGATSVGRKKPMTARPTKSLGGGKGRDHEVLEAAIDLFYEHGYAATSVQDVADAVGMLKGSLYYYIRGKEDLLKRIFQDSHDEGVAIIEAVRSEEGSASHRLGEFLRRWSLWYLNNVKRTSLYAREWRHTGPELRKVLIEQRQMYDGALIGFIKDAQRDGELDASIDVKLATFYIMSAVASLPDWYQSKGRRRPEAIANAYVEYSMRLLGASPAQEVAP